MMSKDAKQILGLLLVLILIAVTPEVLAKTGTKITEVETRETITLKKNANICSFHRPHKVTVVTTQKVNNRQQPANIFTKCITMSRYRTYENLLKEFKQ